MSEQAADLFEPEEEQDMPAAKKAVAVREEHQAPAPAASEAAAIVQMIERAVMNPAVDIDKMERLLMMQERVMERNAKAAFTSALAEMQPKLPVIDQRGAISTDKGKTVQSTYAKYEDINDAIRPLLAEFGFALSFRVKRTDAIVAVTGVLSHREGHSEETTIDLSVDSSGNKNGVQAVGSSISYGKRYAAISLLNITSRAPQDLDDDGNAAGERGMSKAAQGIVAEINGCEDPTSLVLWKKNKARDAQAKVSDIEWREIISLWNRRAASMKGDQANG